MANTINVGLIATSNTFDQWRIATNLLVADVNEIAREDFYKPNGNVIIEGVGAGKGTLTLNNSTGGVTLTVKDDARIDGVLSVDSIITDVDGSVILSSPDIRVTDRTSGGIFRANINTNFNSAYVAFSNDSVGLINVNTRNVIVNTANTLYQNNDSDATVNFDVYTTKFLGTNVVFDNVTTGTIEVYNRLLHVNSGNVYFGNTESDSTITAFPNTTILSQKVTLSNTSSAARFNVYPNTTFFGGGVNVANTTSAATFEVHPNTFIYADANVSLNVNVGGTLEVTGNTLLYSNVDISSNTIISQNANVSGTLNVGSSFEVTGNASLYSNVDISSNTVISQNANVSGTLNVGTLLDVAGNTNLASNLAVSFNITAGHNVSTGNIAVTQNVSAGNVEVVGGVRTSTANVTTLANIATANIVTAYVDSLTLTNPVQGPTETDNDSYRLRVSQTTRGDGSFGVRLGSTANGNAWVTFDTAAGNVWRVTANSTEGTYYTLVTAQNIAATTACTSTIMVAAANTVNTLNNAISTEFGAYNTTFASVNTRITNLNTAAATINSHLGTINTTFGTVNTTFGTVNTTFATTNTAIGNRLTSVSGTSGRITSSGGTTPTIDLATAGAGAASYSSGISAMTVDAYGRVTSVSGSAAYITTDGRAYPRRVGGSNINFNYSGQSGQPSWLWGTNDGTEFYVWNPANFSVSYASSAGNSDTVDGYHASAFALLSGATFSGAIYAPAFFYSSDRKYKENIQTIEDALNKVTNLRGVTYNFKSDEAKRTQLGVIAQEVKQFVPEAVVENEDQGLSVAYGNMVGLLIEAIKDLKKELDSVKTELQTLKGEGNNE